MVDVLKMGAGALLNMQRALTTTGHNISNVNTEGYSRQSVVLGAIEGQNMGFGFLGNGAAVQSVERSYNDFLGGQINSYSSSKASHETMLGLSSRLDELLAGGNGLNASLGKFFNALQDLSSRPGGTPERQMVLAEAENLALRHRKLGEAMDQLGREVNNQLGVLVDEINSLAEGIAGLNARIVSASAAGTGSPPNDLLDKRDQLIRQLSERASVTRVSQDDGSINIYVGKGQGLVIGARPAALQTMANPYEAGQVEIAFAGSGNIVTGLLSGGEVQGLVDFRNRVLKPAQSQLGLLGLGLAQAFNAQHRLGMDLDGALGGDFFTTGPIPVSINGSNGGTAAPTVTLQDAAQLKPSDYLLDYDGSQWQLTRLSDNASVSGAGPLLSLDGMQVDVSAGAPVAGDSFLLNPARAAARSGLAVALSDPRGIAAAAPLSASDALANSGSGTLDALQALPANSLPLPGPITLSFNPDALGPGVPGFDVSGGPGGTLAYDPALEGSGKSFTFAGEGLSFSISGTPAAGDSFTIANNQGLSGDNSNALLLGGLQQQGLLDGGASTLQESHGAMVARVGVNTREAENSLAVESSLLEQAQQHRDSVSGVNLDEEAANLLRYQQLYQAAAQLVKVADDMFQTLIGAIR